MKRWWIAVAVAIAVIGVTLAVAVALPGDIVLPEGPTSSPVPTMTTRNWLNPAFGWRGAIIVFTAVAAMVVIALVARAIDNRRGTAPSRPHTHTQEHP